LTPLVLSGCNSSNSKVNSVKESPLVTEIKTPDPTAELTKNWMTYTPQDKSYTVKFPGKPQIQNHTNKTKIGEIQFLIVGYEDRAKHRAYLTSNLYYPMKPANYDVEKGLDGARDGALKNTKSTLISENKITLNGYSGREILMKDGKKLTTKAKIFIDPNGPILYQILVVTDDKNVKFPEAEAFFNSFNINKTK
jgi:hypothetical protein